MKKLKGLLMVLITLTIIFVLEGNLMAIDQLTVDEIKSVHMTKIEGIKNDYLNTGRFYLKGSPSGKIFHHFYKAENWQDIIFEGNQEVEDATKITIICRAETKTGKYTSFSKVFTLKDGKNIFNFEKKDFEMEFTFMVELNNITPSPTITATKTVTNSVTPTITQSIQPTLSPTSNNPSPTITTNNPITFLPSNTPNNFIVASNKNVTSKTVARNKKLPQTGEGNQEFLLISGGFIMLLGTLFLVSKVNKK